MTTWLVASFGLALIAGAATTVLVASWPRRVTAEEWILRRRQASTPHPPNTRAGWLLPVRIPSRWSEQAGYRVTRVDVTRDIARVLADLKPAVSLNVLHCPPGEDGALQGLLEVMGIPYSPSGIMASAGAVQKDITTTVLRAAGVPGPGGMVAHRLAAVIAGRLLLQQFERDLGHAGERHHSHTDQRDPLEHHGLPALRVAGHVLR